VPLEYPNLSTWSAALTIIKMASQAEEFLMPISKKRVSMTGCSNKTERLHISARK
jgi:hypothetical protein